MCSLWRPVAVALAFCALLAAMPAWSQPAEIPTVQVETTAAVIALVGTWDEKVWFFARADKPLQSLEGLKREDCPFFGIELFGQMNKFFETAGIPGEGGRLVGDGAYNDMEPKPPLYVTSAEYASVLKGVARVVFKEKK